jgi:hypothetical protein
METQEQLTKEKFSTLLKGFQGTDEYHVHKLPFGSSLQLTDGCHFVRENAGGGAYWLFDLILSYQHKLRLEEFQSWKLTKLPDESWKIECSDGNEKLLVRQYISYSDFPMDEFEVWVIGQVCLLPNEY